MTSLLREFWQARTKQERAVFLVLLLTLGMVLYWWLLHSAMQARAQLKDSISTLKTETARLELQAVELERLREIPAGAQGTADLSALLRSQVETVGLSRSLVRIDVANPNQARVVFGEVSFPNWLALMSGLQAQKIRLDACRIEAASRPGSVNVTATFVRSVPL